MTAVAVLLSQTRFQLLATVRGGASLVVGVLLPVSLFVGLGLLIGGDGFGGDGGVVLRGSVVLPDQQTAYVGGFVGYGIMYSAFVALLPELVTLRESGTLKRLRITPLRLATFVLARCLVTLLVTATCVALLLLTSRLVFGISLRPTALLAIAVYTVLGTLMFTSLAFAATTVITSNGGAQGLANLVGIGLAFVSGVFLSLSLLPDVVGQVTRWLPLEPLVHGAQQLFSDTSSGVGLDLLDLGVLAAWAVAGSVIATVGFHWDPQGSR